MQSVYILMLSDFNGVFILLFKPLLFIYFVYLLSGLCVFVLYNTDCFRMLILYIFSKRALYANCFIL